MKSGVGASMACSGGASLCSATAVSMQSSDVSCVSLKLCCVAVDSPLNLDEDASGSKPKSAQLGGFRVCMGSG